MVTGIIRRFSDWSNLYALFALPLLLLPGIARAQACTPAPEGIIAWWPGDDNANDIGGNNDGTLQNGATFADGIVGRAFSFDGSDDKISISNEATFDFTTEVSVDAWIFSEGAEENYQGIVNKGYYSGAPFELRMTRQSGDPNPVALGCLGTHVVFFSVTTDNGLRNAKACLTKGVWHHVAGTYDGAAVRLYLDGELVVSPSGIMSEVPHSGTLIQNDLPVSIGWNGGSGEYWSGLIDEVEIFDRALSADEVLAIYEAGSSGKCKLSPEERIAVLENEVAILKSQMSELQDLFYGHTHTYLTGEGGGHNAVEAPTSGPE